MVVVNHFRFACRIGTAVLCGALIGGVAWGAEQPGAEPVEAGALRITGPDQERDLPLGQEAVSPRASHAVMDAFAGYRFVTTSGNGGRAAQYDYLHSSPFLGTNANYLGDANKFSLDGRYSNEKDFNGEVSYEYKGLSRFTLQTDSFFHNLDHEQVFPAPFSLGAASYTPIDVDPAARFGVRIQQDKARLRYKLGGVPVHLNLQYWRMLREGTGQLVFADHAFEGAQNNIYAGTRPIDRQTHEGRFEVDAHLGWLDLIYDFRLREFNEHASIPLDTFQPRTDLHEVMQRNGGLLQHNENPDSRFYAHTIRLHTSMSGGIVGVASYTYGRRENLSKATDFGSANQTYNILQNVAGDFSYTPSHFFSAALKYRRQDIDRSNPVVLTSFTGIVVNPPVTARPAMDSQKDVLAAILSFRPSAILTFKAELKGEYFSRDNSDAWRNRGEISTVDFPSHSATKTGTFSLLARPFKGAKVKAEYIYSASDSPFYATGYEEKHEGSVQASYNRSTKWGVTARTRVIRENSDHLSITAINPQRLPTLPPEYPLKRDQKVISSSANIWFSPVNKVTVTGSYALQRSSINQPVLLESVLPGSSTLSDYTSQAQIYGLTGTYQHDDRLDLSLALQQVRSYAEFDPQFLAVSATRDTGGIQEISRVNTVENSISARADYRLSKFFSCSLEYAFREYREMNNSLFNGSVNSVMMAMATKW